MAGQLKPLSVNTVVTFLGIYKSVTRCSIIYNYLLFLTSCSTRVFSTIFLVYTLFSLVHNKCFILYGSIL